MTILLIAIIQIRKEHNVELENFALPLKGEALMEALTGKRKERRMIAENFLYEQTTLMISAEPGAGKSTISTQIAVELAGGLSLFGYFRVFKPVKVMYIQSERGIIELLERLAIINKSIPINKDNLIITDEYQKLNLINPAHADIFLRCLKRDYDKAEVIIIDPIYSTISGGLKEDKPASTFTKVMSIIQKELNCSLYYNHHTVKEQHDRDGVKIEKSDPFYGSQWLKAHITGSYYMKKSKDGVNLIRKKDNYSVLSERIELEYHPETELCTVKTDKLPAEERIKNYLKSRKIDQKEFTFDDIQASVQLCNRTIRNFLCTPDFLEHFFSTSGSKNKKIYHSRSV